MASIDYGNTEDFNVPGTHKTFYIGQRDGSIVSVSRHAPYGKGHRLVLGVVLHNGGVITSAHTVNIATGKMSAHLTSASNQQVEKMLKDAQSQTVIPEKIRNAIPAFAREALGRLSGHEVDMTNASIQPTGSAKVIPFPSPASKTADKSQATQTPASPQEGAKGPLAAIKGAFARLKDRPSASPVLGLLKGPSTSASRSPEPTRKTTPPTARGSENNVHRLRPPGRDL